MQPAACKRRDLSNVADSGAPALAGANRAKVITGARVQTEELGLMRVAEDAMVGSMCSLALPQRHASSLCAESLQQRLLNDSTIAVPIMPGPRCLMRISAQLYHDLADYRALAAALAALGG